MISTYNPRTGDLEAEGSDIESHPQLYSMVKARSLRPVCAT